MNAVQDLIITIISYGLGYIIVLAPIIIIAILIIKAVKRSNARRYELEKYKAETERIKAEAMRDKADKE